MQAMRAASATACTKAGVLRCSDAQRSQVRNSGSVLAESIIRSIRRAQRKTSDVYS